MTFFIGHPALQDDWFFVKQLFNSLKWPLAALLVANSIRPLLRLLAWIDRILYRYRKRSVKLEAHEQHSS